MTHARVFTSTEGKKLEGTLISVNKSFVTILRTSDKKKFKIPKTHFIPADQKYFETWKPISSKNIVNDLEKICSQLRRKYKIKVYYKRFPKTSWEIPHTLAQKDDYQLLYQYMVKFDQEFSKYPSDFLKKIDLKAVVFATNMHIEGQRRTAIPDYKEEILLLDFVRGDQSENYQRHVIHHELYHLLEEQINGSPTWQDPNWRKLNEPSFTYGNGGKTVQHIRGVFPFVHPRKGFVNHYSMSSIEEDKAEIFAALFVNEQHTKLSEWCLEDRILEAKMNYMKSFLSRVDNDFNASYWQKLIR